MTFPLLALLVIATAAGTAAFARITKQEFAAAVAGGALILLLQGRLYFRYTSDDAYISFRYARNLSSGAGLVWNPGEHVEGYTNFLWTALLAGFDRIGAEPVRTGRWLGFALALVAIAGAYWLARTLLAGPGGRIAGVIATVLLAASGSFALWAFAGLETSLFASLILIAVLLHLREDTGDVLPLSAAAWAFACMTRPDAALLVAVSAIYKILRCGWRLRNNASGTPWATSLDDEVQHLVVYAALFAALFAPYFAWRYLTYDHLFPNSYYAKVGSGADQYERGLYHLAIFAREHAAWLLVLSPVAIALTSVRRAASAYVLALVLAWFAYIVYVGGDSLVRFRLFAPMLPLMYALIAASLAALVQSVRVDRRPPRWAAEGACALAIGALLLFTLQSSGTDGAIPPERQAVRDRAEIGRWLRDNTPPTTLIAVIPAGAIPYESRLPAIDMLGINDERIAHRDLDLGKFGAGHEKFDSQYVLDRRPDIIILMDTLAERPWRREDYGVLSSGLIPARIDMLATPRLWEEYEPRAARLGEGVWLNLLVRRDASAILGKTQPP